ncbi:MAG: putative DNA-binding transcriptional regulator YafY [Clostridium sp.]|jgi:predicted DNA-binding transcriptional regulator YafY
MSKFSNLLRLLILLKSRKRVKTKELADALSVSERMIRKYMSDLAEANVNVESISGSTGGFELIGYDYLLNLDIKSDEAISLQMATTYLKESTDFDLEVQSACISKRKLRIKYCSLSSGETERIIYPYGLVTRNNLKYIVAYCENRERELTFKLIRIMQVEVLNETFVAISVVPPSKAPLVE